MKKQKFRDGLLFRIDLGRYGYGYGRTILSSYVLIYNYFTAKDSNLDIHSLIEKPILLNVCMDRYAITDGIFEIIGFVKVDEKEVKNYPPMFWQSQYDIEDCKIFYLDGREKEAKPEDCINIQSGGIYGPEHIIKRLINYKGGKGVLLEEDKVKLNGKDKK